MIITIQAKRVCKIAFYYSASLKNWFLGIVVEKDVNYFMFQGSNHIIYFMFTIPFSDSIWLKPEYRTIKSMYSKKL